MESNVNGKKNLYFFQLRIFITLFTGYAIYNLGRKAISLVLPELIINKILSKSDAGIIISSQNLAYAISKFIGGILSDRLSSRLLFSSGLLISGLSAICFALFNDSILLLSIIWFCNGLGQGFGWPSCAKLLRKWFSPEQFGTFWSILSASANVSGTLSPFIATILTNNFNWRITLIVFGCTSILMALSVIILIVDNPEDIGFECINPNAVKSSKKKEEKETNDSESSIVWLDLLKSPFIWLISVCYMVVFAARTSCYDWGQLYLIEENGQSQLVALSFTSSLESGGFFGSISAGYLTDWIMSRKKNGDSKSKNSSSDRLPVVTAMMLMVSLCLHFFCFHLNHNSSPMLIAILGFILGLSLCGPIALFGVIASEAAPANLSGTSHAIVALAANFGAIISGLPFSLIANYYDWNRVFLLLYILNCFSVIALLFFGNRLKPVFEKKQNIEKKSQ